MVERSSLVAAVTVLVLLTGAGSAEARLEATAVSAGSGHACALLSDATVKCWGHNGMGQLGDGTRTRRLTAVAVQGLTGATGVSAGWAMSCATLADGTARCWGANDDGQLGDGTTTNRSTPVAVHGLTSVIAVSAGAGNACALLADRTVTCWGDNSRGTLGNGTRVSSATPVAVPGLTDVTDVSVNDQHACALHANGTVSCWGWTGQLGPVEDAGDLLSPTLVPNLTDAVAVGAGPYRPCALTARGVAECWSSSAPPKVVRGFADVTAFSSSLDGQQTEHSCAITSGGGVKCQSPYPYMGQVGIGLTLTKRVVTVPGLRGVKSISTGSFYTCAVPADGSVRCWGANGSGNLGDGTTETRFRPVAVRGIAKPATGRPGLDVFSGLWGGHTRTLRINRKGRGRLRFSLGCCHRVIDLSFRLSRPRGTYSVARARARVTRVRVFDRQSLGRHVPRVGQVKTVRLKRGIITDPFIGLNYCNEANAGNCGA
jgi:Regulator of Chromosome Condensation (RCC1) repeat protein/regulator of chromosome condensation (RCC1) repeat-containing protein